MADQLATPSDLAARLQSDLDASTATLLIECATAVVQAACGGQRIVQVVNDPFTIMGTGDSWLALPQRPVSSVGSVVLDGTSLTLNTDYKLIGDRLWRKFGWQTALGLPWGWDYSSNNWYDLRPSYTIGLPYQEPGLVTGLYTHGHPSGVQELQLGRNAVLSLAAGVYTNPSGAISERIDDYSVAFEQMTARMEASPHLKAALRKQYGRRAGLVRIG